MAIERLSDALERHDDVLHEGLSESLAMKEEIEPSLSQTSGEQVPGALLWWNDFR